jgi:hypothetical protein
MVPAPVSVGTHAERGLLTSLPCRWYRPRLINNVSRLLSALEQGDPHAASRPVSTIQAHRAGIAASADYNARDLSFRERGQSSCCAGSTGRFLRHRHRPEYKDAAWMKGRPVGHVGELRLSAHCETSTWLPKRMPPLVPWQTACGLRGSDQLADLALSDIPIVSE